MDFLATANITLVVTAIFAAATQRGSLGRVAMACWVVASITLSVLVLAQ